jgi:hypothetical protein
VRSKPPAVAASHDKLGMAGGRNDIRADRQNHLGAGDATPPAREIRKTSDSASAYDPSFRQTRRDGFRLS